MPKETTAHLGPWLRGWPRRHAVDQCDQCRDLQQLTGSRESSGQSGDDAKRATRNERVSRGCRSQVTQASLRWCRGVQKLRLHSASSRSGRGAPDDAFSARRVLCHFPEPHTSRLHTARARAHLRSTRAPDPTLVSHNAHHCQRFRARRRLRLRGRRANSRAASWSRSSVRRAPCSPSLTEQRPAR